MSLSNDGINVSNVSARDMLWFGLSRNHGRKLSQKGQTP